MKNHFNLHSSEISDWVELLNAFVYHRCLRRYQADIIKSKEILASKVYEEFCPSECIIFKNADICYKVFADRQIWALASGLSKGYPIVEICDLETDLVLWPTARKGNLSRTSRLLAMNFSGNPLDNGEYGDPAVLLCDPNFAHAHWNELPGIDHALSDNLFSSNKLHIIAHAEPLQELEYIFSEYADRICVERRNLANLLGRSRRIFVHLGSHFIHKRYLDRILKSIMDTNASDSCINLLDLAKSKSHRIWLACRNDKRMAYNEKEFLTAVIREFSANFDDCIFILDGFSLPNDFYKISYGSVRNYMDSRNKEMNTYISAIADLAKSNSSIMSASGLKVPEAIRVAGNIDYYVSPAGSIQHKVGWFHPANGTIHSNRISISNSALNWYGNQCESSRRPAGIDLDFIEDDHSSLVRGRNANYTIKKVKSVATMIAQDYSLTRLTI